MNNTQLADPAHRATSEGRLGKSPSLPDKPAIVRRLPRIKSVYFRMPARNTGAGTVYRSDIDGLRAIAVLVVVAFHLGVPFVRGGFVGVDIFFVISGYLITGIVASEIAAGTFSLQQFYIRRIRRIFPALLAVLMASALASAFLQFPAETRDFGKSLIAAVFFSSNLYFLSTAQYFGGASDSMPLLHTWSLAVEEQFYLVFPLLLMLIWRSGQRAWTLIVPIAAIAATISFALSVATVYRQQDSAFYLIHFRAWELAAGALLALGLLPPLRNRLLADAIGIGGLVLMALTITLYHRDLHFPGALALAPVAGAAAILYSGTCPGTFVARILSWRPLAFVGLISYSLYLWHWPIIVFWQDYSGHRPGPLGSTVLFSASVLMSVLSWRYIERPMRQSGSLVSRHPWSSLAIAVSTAIAFGAASWGGGGWPGRYTPSQVATAAYLDYDDAGVYRRGTCFIDSHVQQLADFDRSACLERASGKPNVLLVGDSHAAHLWRAFADSFSDYNFMQATASGCKPVVGGKGEAPCLQLINEMITTVVPQTHPSAVILSARWEISDIPALLNTIAALAPNTPKIYVFGPIVTYDAGLPRLLAQAETRGPSIVDDSRMAEGARVDKAIADALRPGPAHYVSLYRILCPAGGKCTTRAGDGSPLQWDYGHLTYQGGLFLASAARVSGEFP